MKNVFQCLKKGGLMLFLPLILTGCFHQKESAETNDAVLKSAHQALMSESVETLREFSKKFPDQYKVRENIRLEVLSVPEMLGAFVGGSVEVKEALFQMTIDMMVNAKDATNPSVQMEIDANIACDVALPQGENYTCNGGFKGMALLKDLSLFLQAQKGVMEASLLPVAVSIPPTVLDKWYEVKLEDLAAKINESGGEDMNLTVRTITDMLSGAGTKNDLEFFAQLLEEAQWFKAKMPTETPTLTPDNAFYQIEVELDKAAIKKTTLDFFAYAMKQTNAQNLATIEAEIKKSIDDYQGKIEGILMVSTDDPEKIKFEGAISEMEGETSLVVANVVWDISMDDQFLLTLKGTKSEETLTLNYKDDSVQLLVEGKEFLSGTIAEDQLNLNFYDETIVHNNFPEKSADEGLPQKKKVANLNLSETDSVWSGTLGFYDTNAETETLMGQLVLNKYQMPKDMLFGKTGVDLTLKYQETDVLNFVVEAMMEKAKVSLSKPEGTEMMDLEKLVPSMVPTDNTPPGDSTAEQIAAINQQIKVLDEQLATEGLDPQVKSQFEVQKNLLEQMKTQLSEEDFEEAVPEVLEISETVTE